jgi:hypothetical protein
MDRRGIRESFNGRTVSLIEWPERAGGLLPPADVEIDLEFHGGGAQCRAHLEVDPRAEMPRAHRGTLARLVTFAAFAIALIVAPRRRGRARRSSPHALARAEYTRVTLESARALKHQFFFVSDPQRLVVDLEGVGLSEELKALPAEGGRRRSVHPVGAAWASTGPTSCASCST